MKGVTTVRAMIAVLRESIMVIENNFRNIFNGTVNPVATKIFVVMIVCVMVQFVAVYTQVEYLYRDNK